MYFTGSSAGAYGVAPIRLSTAIALAAIERITRKMSIRVQPQKRKVATKIGPECGP